MPNVSAKISSEYINADTMHNFIAQLPAVMREIYGRCNLTVSYGWSCNLHQDLLYKNMTVPLDVFPYFIEDSVEQKIYEICESDLLIETPDSNVKILLCHESDIHIDGTDDESIAKIVACFPKIDFDPNKIGRAAINRTPTLLNSRTARNNHSLNVSARRCMV